MKKFYILLIIFLIFQVSSCKKDAQPGQRTQQVTPLENGLVNFSITGELLPAAIDTAANTITVIIPDLVNEQKLTANLTAASQVNATLNSTPVNGPLVFDFSKPVTLTVTSTDKTRSTTFRVIIQTEMQYMGLTGNLVSSMSLNKSYNFYLDQWDGSFYQAINCGPAVTTMAIKWADPTFAKTPADARNKIPENGGWWYTTDVQNYLQENGINSTIDSLSDLKTLVEQTINNNNLLILCLDIYYVPYDALDYQHIQKFYTVGDPGAGHFLLVKGYKLFDDNSLYLEVYDPYSDHTVYTGIDNGQLKGKDRYYLSSSVGNAAGVWWPYAIIVAPKGQNVNSSRLQVNSFGKAKTIPAAKGR